MHGRMLLAVDRRRQSVGHTRWGLEGLHLETPQIHTAFAVGGNPAMMEHTGAAIRDPTIHRQILHQQDAVQIQTANQVAAEIDLQIHVAGWW